MDKETISLLKDYQSLIENSFNKIDETILSFITDSKKRKSTKNSLNQELKRIEKNISIMKTEIQNLEAQEEKDFWREKTSQLKSKFETYSKLEHLENIKIKEEKEDYLDVDVKVNHGKLTSQQAMERGDLIIEVDGQ